jgi:putative DNA primase/helicase
VSASPDLSHAVTLRERDTEMFARIGVPFDLAETAHVERVSDADARERFGIQGPVSKDMAGIVFPYYSHVTGRRVTARVRRDNPEIEDGRPKNKYVNAYGDARHLYFPPDAWEKLQTPSTAIVLVEAEKSSLALSAWDKRTGANLLAVGLGGCWGWRGRIGKADGIDGSRVDVTGALPDLAVCDGRTVYVCLDANAATNGMVRQARAALCKELAGRGCKVKICNLPLADGVNGPDDYIGVCGDDAMGKVIAEAVEPDAELPEFADDALALAFTEKYGDDLRYIDAWGRWCYWNGHLWETDNTLSVFDKARAVCREAAGTAETKGTAQRAGSAVTVAAVERLARSDRRHAATVDQWDADPWLLNTPCGIVDLRTGDIRPSDRTAYCTKAAAVAPDGDCPRWLTFLARVTGDNAELESYLQRMAGYCLTGLTREQALFFLYGLGANGKTVFVNTLTGAMGDYARIAPIELFLDSKNESHPTGIAGLQGARLVSAVETEDGRRWAESKIKALTGGDRVTARLMRQDFFEFTPQFKLLVSGNHRPGLRSVDEAWRRRFNLLPFDVTIPAAERNPRLSEELREEWPGILAWAVKGCLDWQRIGLSAPAAVTGATDAYMDAEDRLTLWIADRCERNRGSWTGASHLFESWKTWAEAAGEFVGSQRRFSQDMQAHGFTPQRNMAGRGFLGIALKGEVCR